MAPAKKKSKTGDGRPTAAAPASAVASPSAASVEKVNKDYYTTLSKSVHGLLALKEFKNLRSDDAIGVSNGGSQAEYVDKEYKHAITKGEQYKCAGNIGWINELYNPLPGVPLNMSLVRRIADHNYRDPLTVEFDFSVVTEGKAWDPMAHCGAIKLASPTEPLHAAWLAAARDCLGDPDGDCSKALRKSWACALRSASFTFVVCLTDMDVHYFQENERENLITLGVGVAHSGFQKVMKLIQFKAKLDVTIPNLTPLKIFEELDKKARSSPFSEKITESYIRDALDIHDKAFSISGVLDLVIDCEGATPS
jgi:hypothetical protein